MAEVLIVDDDTRLSAMLRDYLTDNGYRARTVANARAGLDEIGRHAPDAVILDVMLPDLDGFETCRRIRATSDVPILMLTAKGEETDRIVGLELGADDYLPKPFNPRELLARLKAILRRGRAGEPRRLLRFGRLEIDPASRTVRLDGEDAPMTGHQFDLLVALAENAGRMLSRDQLMDLVTGEELEAFDRSDRRPHLAHPRRNRGRSQASAPHHHRAWRRLRAGAQPGRQYEDRLDAVLQDLCNDGRYAHRRGAGQRALRAFRRCRARPRLGWAPRRDPDGDDPGQRRARRAQGGARQARPRVRRRYHRLRRGRPTARPYRRADCSAAA